jgi:sugar-specific transcriptional regulator TrmB
MIVEKKLINKLKDFGLNSYESKVWVALLSRGISTAGELSDIANVPRSRSYDVLESLEKKGFIMVKVGKPIKYIAVAPEEVLERVKKKISDNADKQSKMLDQFKTSELLDELNLLHKTGVELVDPSELSGALKGRSNVYAHMSSMIKNAEKSIVLHTTSSGLTRKADELGKVLKKASEKGIKIRIAAPITKANKTVASELSKFAEIRHTDNKSRFMVIDGKDLAFLVMDDDHVHPSYDLGLWIKTPFFASSVESMFNHQWEHMKEI